jgi:glutathione S-transferase
MKGSWRLHSLHVSSWSERARWALDHHRLPYQTVEHVPMLGERRLRRLMRRGAPGGGDGKATVPLLVAGDVVVMESWNIARHADRFGKAAALIPSDREAAIGEWSELGDRMNRSLRALILRAMLSSPAALDESAAGIAPRLLRPLLRPIARVGVRYLARKHGLASEDDEARHEGLLVPMLDRLRGALAALPAGSPYLLGQFSYADVAMASSLQGILPVDDRFFSLPPATREVWTRASLASAYADLLAWRDRLYQDHRRPSEG